jgi:hypothetical protein
METSWQLPLWYPLRYEIIIPFVCLSTITKIIHQNRFGDEHAAAIHLKGLKTMIDLRGGLPSLSFREQRRTLFRVFSHPARSAQVKLGDVRKNSGYILQTPTYVTASTTTKSSYKEYDECEEFITYLHAYTSISLSRHSLSDATSCLPLIKPYFHSSTPLHRLLSSPHPNIYPGAHQVKDSALFACVLILHTTLYSLRHSSFATTRYLDKVSDDLRENGLVPRSKGSIEFLLWVLLTNSSKLNLSGYDIDLVGLSYLPSDPMARNEIGASERNETRLDILHLVLRLFTTARKLKPEGWATVKETLVAGLVGDLGRLVRSSFELDGGGVKGGDIGLWMLSSDGWGLIFCRFIF